jgi:hypothetical protein
LNNLVLLATAAAYFAAVLGQQRKLCIFAEKLLIVSQRFTGTHPSAFTRLADGIRRLPVRQRLPATTGIAPEPQLEFASLAQTDNFGESPGNIC